MPEAASSCGVTSHGAHRERLKHLPNQAEVLDQASTRSNLTSFQQVNVSSRSRASKLDPAANQVRLPIQHRPRPLVHSTLKQPGGHNTAHCICACTTRTWICGTREPRQGVCVLSMAAAAAGTRALSAQRAAGASQCSTECIRRHTAQRRTERESCERAHGHVVGAPNCAWPIAAMMCRAPAVLSADLCSRCIRRRHWPTVQRPYVKRCAASQIMVLLNGK